MDEFAEFLNKLADGDQKKRLIDILTQIHQKFPTLSPRVAWNQPMYTDHGTFIIGFSVAKNHISVAAEKYTKDKFQSQLDSIGYSSGKQLFRIENDQAINFDLLFKMVEFNIQDKKDSTKFWRSN